MRNERGPKCGIPPAALGTCPPRCIYYRLAWNIWIEVRGDSDGT